MRKPKFNLLLDQERYDLIVFSLIEMKNHLIQEDVSQMLWMMLC